MNKILIIAGTLILGITTAQAQVIEERVIERRVVEPPVVEKRIIDVERRYETPAPIVVAPRGLREGCEITTVERNEDGVRVVNREEVCD